MTTPFYVSPEQLMKDRADYARKGIARGRSVVVVQYADGLLFVAENQSQALHKVSEIYDRIAFAAVGRYNEFENLRIAGVRLADMRGYAYDRRDVTGRGLANAYAQTLGTIFSSGGEKPYEVEIFVAEVGTAPTEDQVYRLTYDGSVADEHGFAVMGGSADVVSGFLKEHYRDGLALDEALRQAVDALGHDGDQVRRLTADRLEVAILDRTRSQPRKFRRITGTPLAALLGTAADGGAAEAGASDEDSADAGPAEGEAAAATEDEASHDPGRSTQGGSVAIDSNQPLRSDGADGADDADDVDEVDDPNDADDVDDSSDAIGDPSDADDVDDPSDVIGDPSDVIGDPPEDRPDDRPEDDQR